MATIEKLVKALEGLKVFQATPSSQDDSAKKKDAAVSRKDKITFCNVVAECICAANMRTISDFPKFLGIAIEAFLMLCDDPEADVRLVADESLNKTIKSLLETNLGRLQVELYKEIKKNGPSRSVRAALWRFADMAHLIRPQKCRPYMVNLLPCLVRVCQRTEEPVQETLAATINKICSALIGFANDSEIKSLLRSFLPNLHSGSATTRRTAATCLTSVCQHSRFPPLFIKWLLQALMDVVLPVDEEHAVTSILGVLQCLRNIIPYLTTGSTQEDVLKGSFGVTQAEKETSLTADQLLQVYELLLFYAEHGDHNVVTSSLEALQQLLRQPPPELLVLLTSNNTICKTQIYERLTGQLARPRADSYVRLPNIATDEGLEDFEQDITGSRHSNLEVSTSILTAGAAESATPAMPSVTIAESNNVAGASNIDHSSNDATSSLMTMNDPYAGGGVIMDSGASAVTYVADVSDYTGVEIGDVTDERSERSVLSHSSSQDTLTSIRSINSPKRKLSLRKCLSEDLNGNPEYRTVFDIDIDADLEPSELELPDDIDDIRLCPDGDIGSFTDGEIPLLYCARLLCHRFLLGDGHIGDTMGGLGIEKTSVRVSVKALSLGCLSHIIGVHPQVFFTKLLIGTSTDGRYIHDILCYANHSDPQLKGHIALLIGQLIRAICTVSSGHIHKWTEKHVDEQQKSLSISQLMDRLMDVIKDDSSVTTRLGLMALKACLPSLIASSASQLSLSCLLTLLHMSGHLYWLVKVELLELLASLDYRLVSYLELRASYRHQHGNHCNHFLKPLQLQERVMTNIFMKYLKDDDHRVRHCAATNLINIIPRLFHPNDSPHQDPVTTLALEHSDSFLRPILHEWSDEPPPWVQGLVPPYHYDSSRCLSATTEANLSLVISDILELISNSSQSAHVLRGCCHALYLLSEAYTVTEYPSAWACASPVSLLPRDHSGSSGGRDSLRRHQSSTSISSFDELGASSGGGLLPVILGLLTSSSVSLDLLAHTDALRLAGNLFAGCAYQSLCVHDTVSSELGFEDKWTSLGDRFLAALADQLILHTVKLLNACCHIIEEQTPGPAPSKPSLPSLPNPPSLSPIKRKSKAEREAGSESGKTPVKTFTKDKEKDFDKERRKDGMGTFHQSPHYLKLHDMLKGAYSNYMISLDLAIPDKFCSVLHASLNVLSQLLEVATLSDIGKQAEELLAYYRTSVLLDPTSTILCVQQLLKALFGTNLINQWNSSASSTGSSSSMIGTPYRITRLPRAGQPIKPGIYQGCFAEPYTQFTKSVTSSAIRANVSIDNDDVNSALVCLRKRVDRKLPAILKSNSKVDKNSITQYIRLFESLVIKALKQYTVTSCVHLQKYVLNLLSQLVQLRVNYCLLDSEQIFIGFVIKQFEYIEEGQIRNSELLIPHIFLFLVMLSYEKFHSKSIISMPKIIQLCDGIMASGQHPTTHAIPALQPIVHELFLLRGSHKGDTSKDLDTQREVVISMLLRLLHYHQVLELLIVVLQRCRKEGEDKWKRLSRQVTDLLLPMLAKQQVNLDSQVSLDVVHRLFEVVAPSVFRPVDILLKTLFGVQVEQPASLSRWVALVLSVLRVLMVQAKEEVILSRMHELKLTVPVTFLSHSHEDTYSTVYTQPEVVFARFLLQVIGMVATAIANRVTNLSHKPDSCMFLCQELAHILLYVTHLFQSGLFRRVATAAMGLISQQENVSTSGDKYAGRDSSQVCVSKINRAFLSLSSSYPTLTLQWCNILTLLNYDDQSWWSRVMQTGSKYRRKETSGKLDSQSCCQEIVRRGALVLFCDYMCENLSDAEQMTWLIVNHVSDLIHLSQEPPVQDLISAIHRNTAASGLFIQAIQSRCNSLHNPWFMKQTLVCLEAIHLSQSGTLLLLLIERLLATPHLTLARYCDTIACRRVEMLLAENLEDRSSQLSLEDLDRLLTFMKSHNLLKRHSHLASLMSKLRGLMSPEEKLNLSPEKTHPLFLSYTHIKEINIDKDWYVSIVKDQCFSTTAECHQCALLLQKLGYSDILAIMMTKEFSLSILRECLALGLFRTLISYNRQQELESAPKSPDSEQADLASSPEQELVFDPLFKAAELCLLRHMNMMINQLPMPHQVLVMGDLPASAEETCFRERLEDLFLGDCGWVAQVLNLTSALCQYLRCLLRVPWTVTMEMSTMTDIARFCVHSLEVLTWLLHQGHTPSSEQIEMILIALDLCLQNPNIFNVIGQPDHVTWTCACIEAVHQLLSSLLLLPGERLAVLVHETPCEEEEQTRLSFDNSHHLLMACDHISELVQCLESRLNHKSVSNAYLASCLLQASRNVITGLGRLPLVNSYARTPPLVWKMGWLPSPGDDNTKTIVPPPPLEYLQEKDVLLQFIFRVNSLGWTSRQQFEETWMGLLGVLNPVALDEQGQLPPEEDLERCQIMVIAVRAITGLLLQTTLIPQAGNPGNSIYLREPRDKPLAFLQTRCGKKLAFVRGLVEREVRLLMQQNLSGCRAEEASQLRADGLKYLFEENMEIDIEGEPVSWGQISVESIWCMTGMVDLNSSVDSETDSNDSPFVSVASHSSQPLSSSSGQTTESRVRTSSLSGLDTHSCVQFLLELYSQWLDPSTSPKAALMLHNEAIKSIAWLSALFTERQQYEWMLSALLDAYKLSPTEDEISLQYINVCVCKAAAVCGMDSNTSERVLKLLEAGLRSTHLPSRIASLHGVLYLLEAGLSDIAKPVVTMAAEYLLRILSAISHAYMTSQQFILVLWATAFYIVENCQEMLADSEFTSKFMQLALAAAACGEEGTSTTVYIAIMRGLERLLLADVLTKSNIETLMKLSVDRLCLASSQRALPALGLMMTCMYTGKQSDQYSPRVRDDATPLHKIDVFSYEYSDPDSLILAMERVTVLFDRIKKGTPYEARIISAVLPAFLADFFPPQDIMNKVIGEFISNQQPHPQLIAKVVFQVFSSLLQTSQLSLVQDWVMLSLSNFTQRTPLAMAVWSLTCFLIAASTNPWLRALFPHAMSRMGKLDIVESRLFCLAARDFWSRLGSQTQRRAFLSTFTSIAQKETPYIELIALLGSD